jgi:hypothetical protein
VAWQRDALRFGYDRDYSSIDFRAQPQLYQMGKGEQGVLLENIARFQAGEPLLNVVEPAEGY